MHEYGVLVGTPFPRYAGTFPKGDSEKKGHAFYDLKGDSEGKGRTDVPLPPPLEGGRGVGVP